MLMSDEVCHFNSSNLMFCLIFLVDNQLHGRARCWYWIIWYRLSGIFPFACSPHLVLHAVYDLNRNVLFPFQAKCLETGETVAIKKVLQDRRYKNRELQLMRSMDHQNVVSLKHCFFSTTSKDELFLNLVMEYVPETIYRVVRHYSNTCQRMPLIYVKLYTYQVRNILAIHNFIRFIAYLPFIKCF